MNIFNKGFIKTLTSRGQEYYKTISPYEKKLRDADFFNYLGNDKLRISSIKLDGWGSTLQEFDNNSESIRINYQIEKDNYCGGTETIEYHIDFPNWLLDEREGFKRQLTDTLKWHRDNKALWDERTRRSDIDKINELAKKLGYKIEKEVK